MIDVTPQDDGSVKVHFTGPDIRLSDRVHPLEWLTITMSQEEARELALDLTLYLTGRHGAL